MPHMAKRYIIVNDQSTLTMMAWIFPFMGLALILVSGTIGLGGAVQFQLCASSSAKRKVVCSEM